MSDPRFGQAGETTAASAERAGLPVRLPDIEQLEAIRYLAKEQQGALRHGQVQRFEALLERRQTLIDALEAPAPAANNVILFPTAVPAETQRVRALQVLEEIMTLDRENEETLQTRVTQVQESLGTVRRGRHAQQRYAPAPPEVLGRIERSG